MKNSYKKGNEKGNEGERSNSAKDQVKVHDTDSSAERSNIKRLLNVKYMEFGYKEIKPKS
jgi:hypothetical protein